MGVAAVPFDRTDDLVAQDSVVVLEIRQRVVLHVAILLEQRLAEDQQSRPLKGVEPLLEIRPLRGRYEAVGVVLDVGPFRAGVAEKDPHRADL